MKKILKYIIIFFIVLALLFSILVITAKIPRELIEENIKESTDIFWKFSAEDNSDTPYNIKHYYADAMILYIIYYIDTDNVLESVMEAKYYSSNQDETISFAVDDVIENNEANTQYIRYWHGSMSILRPLLIFFNIQQIYVINAVLILLLILILLIKLRKNKELVVAILIGLVMCAIWTVPFCQEYTWTFYIMLIASIILVELEKRKKNINILFFITGMITCYLDFLTNEIITLFVPLIILLVIKYKKNEINNFKEGVKLIGYPILLWGIGYIGMWCAKWILASIILKVNALDYVIGPAMKRINGTEGTAGNYTSDIIPRNIKNLFPIAFLIEEGYIYWILGAIIIFELIFIRKKEIKKLWFSLLLLIIAIIPYIRYLVLENHSYLHYFFTFRSQIITIIAIVLAMVYSLDKSLMKHKIGKNVKKLPNGEQQNG